MRSQDKLIDKVDSLLEKADKMLKKDDDVWMQKKAGNDPIFDQIERFNSSTSSFISKLFGTDHNYYTRHQLQTDNWPFKTHKIATSKAILLSIKDEIEEGWLMEISDIVSAEIFVDFMEMAEHFISKGYRIPSAVIIGSVLEERLRQLCIQNSIDITVIKDNKAKPKKAETLNVELYKKEVYNKIEMKNITSWLGIRNAAAHGKYDEFTIEQVKNMCESVQHFLSKYDQ